MGITPKLQQCSSNMFSFSFVWVPRCDNGESFFVYFFVKHIDNQKICCIFAA